MKITKISKENKENKKDKKDCGGFQRPKGHLDTQMFPECEGSKFDRDIVKKTEERKSNSNMKIKLSKNQWQFIGKKTGWIKEADKKSPTEHGFMEQCIEENKDKKDPGAYCASIVDNAKGTTEWRKGPKNKE